MLSDSEENSPDGSGEFSHIRRVRPREIPCPTAHTITESVVNIFSLASTTTLEIPRTAADTGPGPLPLEPYIGRLNPRGYGQEIVVFDRGILSNVEGQNCSSRNQ